MICAFDATSKGQYFYKIWTSLLQAFFDDVMKSIYNHATSNLAIYSHETSQDKLPEA